MNIKKYLFKNDLLLAACGAIAGLCSQDIWFQKVCVANGEILKIGSCKIFFLRYLLGALLGAIGWIGVRIAFELYCKEGISENDLSSFRNRISMSLSPLFLAALNPFIGRPPALIPALVFISLLSTTLTARQEIYRAFKKNGLSVWSVLIINSFFTLFVSDLMASWIGYQQVKMTFPTQFIFHNWILIHFVMSGIYLVSRRPIFSSLSTFIIFSILNFSAGEKLKFLGLPLYPWDLQMTGDGTAIIKEIWDIHSSIAVLAAVFALGAIFKFTQKALRREQGKLSSRSVFFGVTTLCAALVVSNETPGPEEIFPDFHGVRNSQLDKGSAYFLTLAYKVARNKKEPARYSKEAIQELAEKTKKLRDDRLQKNDDPVAANVIFYMIESFFDPTEMGVRFKNDPLSYFHSLKKDASYGHMAVSIYGGGTANTEYEVMTGLSISQLLPGILAYYQLPGKTPSLAWLFKQAGYSTHAFNGWSRNAFNWDKVYPSMGVDHFVAMNEDLPNSQELYGLYSDEGIVDLVLDAERKTKDPVFVAVVTNATHIPYEKRIPYNAQFEVLNPELSKKTKDVFTKYAEVVHHTDIALKRLIETLSQSSKKTILIAYGDHLPGITYAYDELAYFKTHRKERMHQVPLLIWDNFGAKKENLFLSSNFLGSKVLSILRLRNQGHFELIRDLSEKTPVVSHAFEINAPSTELKQLLDDYELLEHDLVGGKGYLKNLIDTGVQ